MSRPFGIRGHRIAGLPVGQLAIRFAFGAGVSLIAGIVSETAGIKVGGILLAFPAILPAALTLIEREGGTSSAVSDVRGAVVGAFAMVLLAITVMYLATRIPVIGALAVAGAVWLLAGVGVYILGQAFGGMIGEEVYLPDVGAREAAPLVDALRAAQLRVATAESCTGGALAALLTAVPKASDAVAGGITAYTNDAKSTVLELPDGLIERDGAVTRECATCMADAAKRVLQTDVGIGITGAIGSPIDGVEPGTMFVAVSGPAGSRCERIFSGGGPEAARSDAIRTAIRLGLEVVKGSPA